MRALVTGGTGKLGHAVASALLERGHQVRALARDPARAAAVLPTGAEPVRGDVTDPASLRHAAEGCELVFNAMGLPEQWFADEGIFERVNALGSEAVVRAAAEEAGNELVIVNPAAVYGPGPGGSASFERQLFEPLVTGSRLQVPALPPGGCGVVFTGGVGRGQLLAAERGRPGERYILCDGHATIRELAAAVVRIAGRGRVPPTLPAPLARAMAAAGEALSRIIRKPPLLPRGQLNFFLWNASPDPGRAKRELGWGATPLEDGLRATLAGMGLA